MMNTASVFILVCVGIFFALAVWRVAKKGAPCSCGCDCKSCGGCKSHGEKEEK